MTTLQLLSSLGLGRNCFIRISRGGFRTISSSTAAATAKMSTECYTFGPYKIDSKEVFYSTPFSYAMVNLRPVVPGHVLVCPRREVKRFVDLTVDETSDLWLTAQRVGGGLEGHHKASSLTFTIQSRHFQGPSPQHFFSGRFTPESPTSLLLSANVFTCCYACLLLNAF
ncbi:bifunctional bis(5'-adenosyl)-triphosphatase/adenylylsulfatase FHIT isoform X2 [Herrania umbratica]|uniref:Bifunctional bis(5'-adenosyl)-triphosphatase/adenylylsulfatase FHIT isoform X2 n=1 Tax=Herrania umbratica TaxID=108875 RepID=A0A6J0ZWI5_9ROSI|nr:bifunctional bis(5'-adenosyl)-triphosphatase/adenylylsulfatase FHIT isoform X2 [Herrania umbratica]